jgi:antitoxin component of RelBE/YafQ-DinJ toxin-antitoxin module
MKDSRLELKISTKLKAAFAAQCEEREISVSDAVRDLIAKNARNHKQGPAKRIIGDSQDR